jgi:hypothetical protein
VSGFLGTRQTNRHAPHLPFSGMPEDAEMVQLRRKVILPIVGILLELVNSRFARWINVGCFTVAGCFWLAGAIWWHSDPFFGVLLIVAMGLLTIAGLTETVYLNGQAAVNRFVGHSRALVVDYQFRQGPDKRRKRICGNFKFPMTGLASRL